MERLENFTLADLAQRIRGDSGEYTHFHARLYSFIVPGREQLLRVLEELELTEEVFPNRHPAAALIGDFSKAVTLQTQLTPYLDQGTDKLVVFAKVEPLRLPESEYLCLVSPNASLEPGSNQNKALESIAFLRTLLCLFWGRLSSSSHVAEFDFDHEGNISLPSPVFRMPLHADFVKIVDASIAKSLSERLETQLPDFRARVQRASNFVFGALDQSDEAFRFAGLWIALEVLVSGRAPAIRGALARAYRIGQHEVDGRLLFGRIAAKRNNLNHQGRFGILQTFEERLLQLYFFDILLDQLNLPHVGLAETVVTSGLVEQELDQNPSPNLE